MKRYAAFLRGVMPTNCKMADLRKAFEAAGFRDVKTVLSSGNVVFDARPAPVAVLERRAEAAMAKHLPKSFLTVVRAVEELRELLAADPWKAHRIPSGAKQVVTFLKQQAPRQLKPAKTDCARIVAVKGSEVFTWYVRSPKGPEFMSLIEKACGKEQTTRTWQTVAKVAAQ